MNNYLLSKQNDPENIKLLRASSVAYKKAKRGEIKITFFLLFLAIAYPICYLFIKDETIKFILFGCSFLITILIQIFSVEFIGNTSKGAIFKEVFDTNIFNMPWKTTLKKPERSEVLHYSKQYNGEEIKNWYSPNLLESIEHNIAIAILQHSNTSWDIELRKAFRKCLISVLIYYSVILFSLFVILKVDGLLIFLLLFSLLSFFTHFISLIRGHTRAIRCRESISKHLDEIIQNKKHISINELRDIQDEIYYSRQEPAKVPNFFFLLYKKRLNSEIEEYIKEVNNKYSL